MLARSLVFNAPFLVLCAILSSLSICYELVIAKVISLYTGQPIIWESISIGTFIAGLAVGALRFEKLSKVDRSYPLKRLVRVECLLTIVGGGSVLVIALLHILYRTYLFPVMRVDDFTGIPPVHFFALVSQIIVFSTGVLSGFELPALMEWLSSKREEQPDSFVSNQVLAFYYLGALLGTWIFLRYALPNESPSQVMLWLAGGNFLVAIILTIFTRGSLSLLVVTGIALIACAGIAPKIDEWQVKNHYYNHYTWEYHPSRGITHFYPKAPMQFFNELSSLPTVTRYRSRYQTIDFVPHRHAPEADFGYTMYLNGRFQFSTFNERDYHDHFSDVPLATIEAFGSTTVLVIGGGDGLLVRNLLRDSRIAQIVLVEIDPLITELASTSEWLLALNLGALDHERVTVLNADALQYLRNTDILFSAIFVDLNMPFDFDIARLYSVEFLKLLRHRLDKNGIMALAHPFEDLSREGHKASALVATNLEEAGFKHIYAFNSESQNFVMVTTDKEVDLTAANDRLLGFDETVVTPGYFTSRSFTRLVVESDPQLRSHLWRPKLLWYRDTFL